MIKRVISFFILLYLLSLQTNLFSQQNVSIEFYETEGEITGTDLMKKEFGRYDGFELPMNKGENAYFFVYSTDFNPSLVLVDPQGNVFLQKSSEENDLVILRAEIPTSGNWYLYVLGSSAARGKYIFHYGFAGENALNTNAFADDCSKIKFLAEHSKAHFNFLDESKIGSLPVLKGAKETFLHSDDASYNSVLYDGDSFVDANKKFDQLEHEIKNCLNSKWKINTNKFEQVGDHLEKSVEFSMRDGEKSKVVQIILTDFTKTAERFYSDYAVVLLINSI